MFGHRHYVPVLRMKPAELRALRSVDPVLRSRITPLLECPARVLRRCDTPKALDARFDHIVRHIAQWAGRAIFIDFDTLPCTVPQALEVMVVRATLAGIRPVLVMSLKMASQYARSVHAVLERHDSGLCLRLSPEDLRQTGAGEKIENLLTRYGASPEQVDLVIDRGGVDSGTTMYEEFADRIPCVDAWRTLTVLAGSFPEDLARFAAGRTHRLRRFEWRQWQALESWPGRKPAFGDYTIQHVLFKEPVAVPNFSASVRYTMEDEYLVLRGEGVLNENGPGYSQWNAWASLLVEMPEFAGSTFSAGDRYIRERADNWRIRGALRPGSRLGFPIT